MLTQSHHKACIALKGASKGTQIFVDYGDRPNHELLLHFGFALDLNPYDLCVAPTGLALETSLKLFRRKLPLEVATGGDDATATAQAAKRALFVKCK